VSAQYNAKTTYRDKEIACQYDTVRFRSSQGKARNVIEKNTVRELIPLGQSGGLVLDLATGTGRFGKLALDNGICVIGADISLEMLQVCSKKWENYKGFKGVVMCDAERLPFADSTFDGVIAIRLMVWVPPEIRRNILGEMKRVTKRWAIVNFPNSISANIILRLTWKFKRKKTEFSSVTLWQLTKEVHDAGFDILNVEGPLLIPPGPIPRFMLPLIKGFNRLLAKLPSKFFSEEYFVLLRKP